MQSKISCVHIGIHKTASTWMQLLGFNLHPHIKLLNSVNTGFEKFWVDEFLKCGDFRFSKNRLLERIDQEINPPKFDSKDVFILSEENISGHIYTGCNAKIYADRIFDSFGKIKIFMMIRKQSDYLLSAYSNFINHGGALSLEVWLTDENFPINSMKEKLKYDLLISYYMNLFGKENVFVLPYEFFFLKGEIPVMNAFFEFLGLEPIPESGFHSSKKVNASFSPIGVRFARLVNGIRGGGIQQSEKISKGN